MTFAIPAIDLTIVVIYLAAMIAIGFYAKKLAAKGVDSYFLGERSMRWWMLAMSGWGSSGLNIYRFPATSALR